MLERNEAKLEEQLNLRNGKRRGQEPRTVGSTVDPPKGLGLRPLRIIEIYG